MFVTNYYISYISSQIFWQHPHPRDYILSIPNINRLQYWQFIKPLKGALCSEKQENKSVHSKEEDHDKTYMRIPYFRIVRNRAAEKVKEIGGYDSPSPGTKGTDTSGQTSNR